MEDKDETHYGLNGSPTQVKRIFPPTANDHHEVWDGDGSEVADKIIPYDHRYEIYLKGGMRMPKLVIHQEKVEDPQVLVDICPFGAMEEKDGKLSIKCRM
mgnify:CR=1 FL=1